MTTLAIAETMEKIYQSLHDDNAGLDAHISALKTALAAAGEKSVEIDVARIVQNNREGRKLMESYFRKRGVTIVFPRRDERGLER